MYFHAGARTVGAMSLSQAAFPFIPDDNSLCSWTLFFPSLTSTTRSSSDALQRRYGAPELEVSSFLSVPCFSSGQPLCAAVFFFFLI